MEDYTAISLSLKEGLHSNEAFLAVFDSHGGEVAEYASKHLWTAIQDQLTDDLQSIRGAMSDAYIQLHRTMEENRSESNSFIKVHF